jgi:predicted small lipoprotein YifL
MQNISSLLSLLTPFLLVLFVSACGSKGPLYQTPKSEPVVIKKIDNEQEKSAPQSKKIN